MGKKFESGHRKLGGRAKGSPNKRTLLSVAGALTNAEFHPIPEILRLIAKLKTPAKKIEVYQWLTEWACVKPKDDEDDNSIDVTPDEDNVTTEELLKLVRSTDENGNK